MLVKVSIENFKSFDSKTEFTMISSNKIRSHRDHKIEIKGKSIIYMRTAERNLKMLEKRKR